MYFLALDSLNLRHNMSNFSASILQLMDRYTNRGVVPLPMELLIMASDFYDIVRKRRSVRSFDERIVENTVLKRILTTTILAPSAHNAQPARFFVIPQGKMRMNLIDMMSEAYLRDLINDAVNEKKAKEIVERSRSFLESAPVLILAALTMRDMWAYPDDERRSHEYVMAVQSTAAAIQNLLLSAQTEGLASCWLCAPLFTKKLVVETLDLEDDIEPQAFIILGHSNRLPPMPQRKPYEEIVHTL
jgi:coenzyme F420-0:L-glutamate ligase/coenzyme F420-1:gamma-L-glutamate ligase